MDSKTIIKDLRNSIEEFRDRVQVLEEEAEDMYRELLDLEDEIQPIQYGIKDVDNFIFRAKADNILTPDLEKWIENYIRFYND